MQVCCSRLAFISLQSQEPSHSYTQQLASFSRSPQAECLHKGPVDSYRSVCVFWSSSPCLGGGAEKTALPSSWWPNAHIKGAQASAHRAVYPAARSKAAPPVGSRAARKASGSVRELPNAQVAVITCLLPVTGRLLLCISLLQLSVACVCSCDDDCRIQFSRQSSLAGRYGCEMRAIWIGMVVAGMALRVLWKPHSS